jgi:hypothetical protein
MRARRDDGVHGRRISRTARCRLFAPRRGGDHFVQKNFFKVKAGRKRGPW